jgi:hypothetical protein
MIEMDDAEKKALNRAVSIINTAYKAEEQYFSLRQFYKNMYHAYDPVLLKKSSWQTKFAHPFPFFLIETQASFLYEGVYGVNNPGLWDVLPWGPDSEDQAEINGRLLNFQEESSEFHEDFYEGSKNLQILGDWFLESYWDREEDILQQPANGRYMVDGTIDRPIYTPRPRQLTPVITKNQPEARTLNNNSIWVDPQATRLENARYFCIRDEMTFDDLKEMEQYGRFMNVDMLKGTSMPKISNLYYDQRQDLPFIENKNSKKGVKNNYIEKENQMVEVIRIIYPATGEVETIGNRKVYLGRYIPHLNVKNTVQHIKNYGETDQFHGTSTFEHIAAHWKLINKMQSLEADGTLNSYRGYWMVRGDAGNKIQDQLTNLRPGGMLTVKDLASLSHNYPDPPSPIAFQSRQQLIQDAYQAAGFSEILGGATPSSNVRSAGQQAQLANFSAKMMSQTIRNIMFGLKKMGKTWLMLNYEKLDVDQLVPLDGINSVEKWVRVGPDQINPLANLSVRLSNEYEALKEKKLEQMLQAIQLAQNVPGFNNVDVIKQWFKTQGVIRNLDKVFLLPEEQSAQLALQPALDALQAAQQEPEQNQELAGQGAMQPPGQGM